MKIVSFNVNGLRSAIDKGIEKYLGEFNSDFICLQEIKCQSKLLDLDGYYSFYNFSNRKGYSGVAIFSKNKPLSVNYNFNNNFDIQGRVLSLEYQNFYLLNVYFPCFNSSLQRINYLDEFSELFSKYVKRLDKVKPVIICGDFNVNNTLDNSFEFIDNNVDEFNNLLDNGFIDAFSYLYPNKGCYTWYQNNSETKNRLDYFLVSDFFINSLVDCVIHKKNIYSDHCLISLELDDYD